MHCSTDEYEIVGCRLVYLLSLSGWQCATLCATLCDSVDKSGGSGDYGGFSV
jgi:hypothetical protein